MENPQKPDDPIVEAYKRELWEQMTRMGQGYERSIIFAGTEKAKPVPRVPWWRRALRRLANVWRGAVYGWKYGDPWEMD